MVDDNGKEIRLGDILDSKDGYSIKVVDNDGWKGALICKPGHSCENIPYDLNNGEGYIRRKK